jgi:hypothetical protein
LESVYEERRTVEGLKADLDEVEVMTESAFATEATEADQVQGLANSSQPPGQSEGIEAHPTN